jgi:TPR repeat protein
MEYFMKAVEMNYSDGFFQVAKFYQNGYGVAVDKVKAKFYYKKACVLNNSTAFYHLGCIYEDEKKYNKMAINYTKAYQLDANDEDISNKIAESPLVLNLGKALMKIEILETRIENQNKLALQEASVGKRDQIVALIQQFL